MGRIAEGMGLKSAARKAYTKVEKPEEEYPSSTYNLTQRRLKML